MAEIILKKTGLKTKTCLTLLGIAAAVALPQVFHGVGILSGTGALLGSAFLPMHLPVLLAGLLGGPIVGVIAGAVSPLLSFALSGMPALQLLPFMMLELAGYGLAGGLLAGVKMPVFFKLLIAQLAGRFLRTGAVLIAVYGLGVENVGIAGIWSSILTGLPGILLQWALVPLLVYRLEHLRGSR